MVLGVLLRKGENTTTLFRQAARQSDRINRGSRDGGEHERPASHTGTRREIRIFRVKVNTLAYEALFRTGTLTRECLGR